MTAQFLIALLTVLFSDSHQQQRPPQPTSVTEVTYCDLIRNPALYMGQTVRVRATYEWGFEWQFLYDRGCMSRGNRAWLEDADEDRLCAAAKKNFKKLKDKGFTNKADVVVVGRLYDKGGYGHLNGYKYQFEMSCLESAKQIPSDAP